MQNLLIKHRVQHKTRLKQGSSSYTKSYLCRVCKKPKDFQKTFDTTTACTCTTKNISQKPYLQKTNQTLSTIITPVPLVLTVPKISGLVLKPRNFSNFSRTSDPSVLKNIKSNYNFNDSSTYIDSSLSKAKRKDDASKFKFLIYKGNNSGLIKTILSLRANWSEGYYSLPSSASFIWMPISQTVKFERLKASCNIQCVNHFEFHREISDKSKLFSNLTLYCASAKTSLWNIVPMTFVIDFRAGNCHSQLHSFKVYMINADSKNLPPTHFVGENVWIMKPAGLNRGRGIMVFNDIDTFEATVKDIMSNKTPGGATTYVIQKYIEKPLLIYNRKFDIRVWVLITQSEDCYFFPQGYLRTSSENFSLDNLDNNFIHLTNNAIQKDGKEYGKFENGNQMSFKQFQEYLQAFYGNIRLSSIISVMKSQIIISLMSVKGKLNPNGRQSCFEIFGYDFIIDSFFKPWLIEVNTNPCIELSSPLLEQIIPRMLDDALELTVDMVFHSTKTQLKTPLVLDLPQGNMWEFLVSLNGSANLLISGVNL